MEQPSPEVARSIWSFRRILSLLLLDARSVNLDAASSKMAFRRERSGVRRDFLATGYAFMNIWAASIAAFDPAMLAGFRYIVEHEGYCYIIVPILGESM